MAGLLRGQSHPAPTAEELAASLDDPVVAQVDSTAYFRMESHDAPAADVELARGLLCSILVRLRAEFGAQRVDRLLTGIDCTVHVYGQPSDVVQEGLASIRTGREGDRYRADLRVLATSAHRPQFRSAAGQGPGPDYSSKVLAHEYGTILLERLTQDRPGGWRFFQAPAWFVQGSEEYFGIVMSRPRNRAVVLPAYLRQQKDASRVRFASTGITVTDPYVDGTALVCFLDEQFGRERLLALLAAPQATFAAALGSTLGTSLDALHDQWQAWRTAAVARADWLDAVRAARSDPEIAAAVVDQDLKQLPEDVRDKVVDALRRLAGKDVYWRGPGDGSPHRLFRRGQGATRWVLVVTHEGMEIPGWSWMAVHQFDAGWKETAVLNYPTGYRIALFDVWQERVAVLPDPAVVVRLGSVGSHGNFTYRQRQYYAVGDGHVALVRLEEEGKDLTRGEFSAAHPWTGPKPPQRSATEWIDALRSDQPATVLATLTWLGGHHLGSAEPRHENVNEESLADAKLWESVRDDPRTRTLLTKLAESPHRWVREAAALALRPR